ncbi:right-handed parallel beta-helix repeat-containing protein [candidate division KSB1 bacterium]|nr:right-handed parallel beta-helix repeat-containing protein [candidate division KSB1 bacterium]
MTRVWIFIICIFIPHSAFGADYYVDNVNGKDNNAGTSPGQAWQSIYKLNTTTFSPGDHVLFKRGGIWRDQLKVTNPGTATAPIVYGAYGSGVKPFICAARLLTNWNPHSTNVWSISTSSPKQVFFDTKRGTRKSSVSALSNTYDWCWDDDVLYVVANMDPDDLFRSPGVEMSVEFYAVFIRSSYIVLEDIRVGMAEGDGVLVTEGADHVVIRDVESSGNYWTGIKISDSQAISNACSIHQCTIFNNGASGIALTNIEHTVISNNNVTQNCRLETGEEQHSWDAGIKMTATGSRSNIIEHNISSKASNGAGIWLDFCGRGNVIRYNRIYDNVDNGIYNEITSGTQIYYNLSYNNTGSATASGIWISGRAGDPPYGGDADDNMVVNNVCYGNGGFGILLHNDDGVPGNTENNYILNNIAINTRTGPNLRVGGAAEKSVNTIEHNCFGPESSRFIEWGWNHYLHTYDAFENAYGGPTYSVEKAPLFVEPLNDDFHLQPESPAIDAGTTPVLRIDMDMDETVVPQGTTIDVGVYEFIPSAPPPPMTYCRINCGGSAYTDKRDRQWNGDQAYSGGGYGYVDGSISLTQDPITGTEDDPLYQTVRNDISAYRFTLANGDYIVILHFSEIDFTSLGARGMDIYIEGKKQIANLDVFAEMGHDAALKINIPDIRVNDDQLDIEFNALAHVSAVSAIEVYNTDMLDDTTPPSPPDQVKVSVP